MINRERFTKLPLTDTLAIPKATASLALGKAKVGFGAGDIPSLGVLEAPLVVHLLLSYIAGTRMESTGVPTHWTEGSPGIS